MSEPAIRKQSAESSEVQPGRGRVRPYSPADREAVRRICCDTGFLGRPVDRLYCDRELFADLMTGPYLDFEPDWTWVAESDGQVVGYLLGSVSPRFGRNQMTVGARTVCRMLGRLLAGRYTGHPRSREYLRWLIFRACRERPLHPPGAAHLHFNLQEGFRGRLGFQLWSHFDRHLRAAGIEDLYGEFFSYPGRRPEEVYLHYGFTLFDRRQTTLFRREIGDPVHLVCVHRKGQGQSPFRRPEL